MPEVEDERRALSPTVFACDNVCLIIIWILVAVMEWGIDPFQRGFFCDDQCIQYPYKKQTVSFGVMVLLAGVPPLITMVLVEMWRVRQHPLPLPRRMGSQTIPPLLVEVIQQFVGVFLFGCGGTMLLTEVCKCLVGRLRPHFMAVCDPDPEWLLDICSENGTQFVTTVPCRGDASSIREGRLSFPSGHTSLAFYASICMSLYLQSRLSGKVRPRLFIPTVQVFVVAAALAIALTRISDNYHHPTDVIAGATMGAAGALLTAFYISDWFHQSQRKEERLPLNQTANWPKINEATTNRHDAVP